jgi:hypothetical protein
MHQRSCTAFTALLLLVLCGCQHAAVRYESHPLNRGFFIAPLASGELVPAGWTGRKAAKPDDKVDFFFMRDSDGAWIAAHGYVAETQADADLETSELLRRSMGNVIMVGMRFSNLRFNERSNQQLNVTATQSIQPLDVEDASAVDMAVAAQSPPLQLYVALVRRGSQSVVVMAGRSRGGTLPADEARDFARRVRFEISAR